MPVPMQKARWAKLLCCFGLMMGCGTLAFNSERNDRIDASPNFVGGRFVNLKPFALMENGGVVSVMKERLFNGNRRKPGTALPQNQLDTSAFPDPPADFQAVWLGHSFLIMDIDGVRILMDPVFDNAAPVPFVVPRFQPPPIFREALPRADMVIISHNHYDHLEKHTVRHLAQTGILFLVPLGLGERLTDWGVAGAQIVELDWWESFEVRQVKVLCTPSQHFSSRTLWDRNKTLWGSWTVVGPRHRIFFSSDGGWGDHFAEIGRRHGPFDATFIEIGAYADQWPHVHLRPEQAVQAHLALQGQLMVPVHWAAFDLGLHAWDEPIERTLSAARQNGVALATPEMGQLFTDMTNATALWWRFATSATNAP